ncbi:MULTISPECIES: efflux RND transporter periplasmic adaptor subunit [unclassified Campylobacter]|uniref:efflux RND transporter periplasmic adaptor subunit n=1 Tax=unclassified Campylobacter TaxID=2593542 RepID=UPI0022E9EE3D|nr:MULTISPECIES: efflux RND transporter periplasmic adaptor subunit [unclassified Campylobacter]MDA3080028.1 efflux RND transporter periplasmic adaptor subunit [Campylobacter sp. CS_NA2]MDA3081754.1 efflux RND transporter periplasmic adaptor subunit [Campylobacter sp. CS_NA1]MDA3086085.1 efflux RND transporter periplasmic adaptor subunit [Campylobacter sp. CS_ED1]MDA3090966.1 efflux RND transporter periplasmic adaptor subunit [Campylobacter sp. CS_ED2]WBR51234.1 efflux RND transporter periplas
MSKLANLAILAILLSGCSYFEKKDKNAAAAQQQMPPLPVGVITAKTGDMEVALSFNGQIVGELDVVVKAKVVGTIEKQNFTPGQAVNEGDILFEIDSAKYEAAYNIAKANFDNANADLKRAKNLRASNAISQREYDAAVAAYNITNANLTNAKIDLDYSKVKAPFSGVVGDNLKDVGAYVSGADSDLVRLTKLDPIYVKFGISDVEKLKIDTNLANGEWEKKNSSVSISVAGKDYNGTLKFIDNVVNSNTATVDAKAEFDNPNLELKPGTYARVKVGGFHQKNGAKLPQIAVLQDLSNPFVYVVENGKIAKKIVKVISQTATEAIISEGINDGDLVVIDNFKKIRVGLDVAPLNEEARAAEAAKMQAKMQQAQTEGQK